MKRKLETLDAGLTGLGAPTIMDRALAARHGGPYVRLVAFAIDVDRAYGHDPDPDARPLGWEVYLVERQLLAALATEAEDTRALLEDVCMSVLDQPPDEQALGSQVVFAVYHAMLEGKLPDTLRGVFRAWRKKPRQLMDALDALWAGGDGVAAQLAAAALAIGATMEPSMAAPTVEALRAMAGEGSDAGG